MSTPIIRVENLGKCYRIRHESRERYTALRDVIARKIGGLVKAVNRRAEASNSEEDFWALKDVSFEVNQGEVVGIIGRNGAGKSTLLKILSRITEPTKGRITLNGRVASLLEVGTGFHPELTGRENIFLNGAILGMTKAEIKSKFDEIVAFAEVERFLDTPVKRYSSGMYVRLAFAVAAHLEPEILVVDEVLAVGDAEFQKKCLGKMGEVAKGGRTVLFVSHQMAAVDNLCDTGLLLEAGHLTGRGEVAGVMKKYLSVTSQIASIALGERKDRNGSGLLRFERFSILDAAGNAVLALACGSEARFELRFKNTARRVLRNVRVAIGIDNHLQQRILVLSTHFCGQDFAEIPADTRLIIIRVPSLGLAPGRYSFTLYASVQDEAADWIKNAGSFDVEGGDFYGTGQMPTAAQGHFVMRHEFRLEDGATLPAEFASSCGAAN